MGISCISSFGSGSFLLLCLKLSAVFGVLGVVGDLNLSFLDRDPSVLGVERLLCAVGLNVCSPASGEVAMSTVPGMTIYVMIAMLISVW
jgi:hypothetical protein